MFLGLNEFYRKGQILMTQINILRIGGDLMEPFSLRYEILTDRRKAQSMSSGGILIGSWSHFKHH